MQKPDKWEENSEFLDYFCRWMSMEDKSSIMQSEKQGPSPVDPLGLAKRIEPRVHKIDWSHPIMIKCREISGHKNSIKCFKQLADKCRDAIRTLQLQPGTEALIASRQDAIRYYEHMFRRSEERLRIIGPCPNNGCRKHHDAGKDVNMEELQSTGSAKNSFYTLKGLKVPDYETDDHRVNARLEIQIEDFITNKARVYREIRNPGAFIESFYVTVYPNGADEKTEGQLVVFPNVDVSNAKWIPKRGVLRCIISLIDVEGYFRFPKTFVRPFPFVRDHGYERYFKRSFILKGADYLLSEGVLTVRCDFYFTWSGLETSWDTFSCDVKAEPSSSSSQPPPLSDSLTGFLSTIPQSVCSRNGSEAEDSSDKFTVLDFTHRILTLPQFDQSRERFGVYGIPPASSSLSSDSKEESTDALEHIWIFDTRPDRFLLSLEEREDNVGFRLLEASPLIRQCVNVDMKEKRKKRVEFSEMDSRTFIIVLYFLENKTIPPSTFRELVDVYTFSHLHEMKVLQQKCSEEMVRSLEFPNDLEELKRMASLYSDEYLSSLLDSRWHEFENSLLMLPRPKKDDRPDSDSYI